MYRSAACCCGLAGDVLDRADGYNGILIPVGVLCRTMLCSSGVSDAFLYDSESMRQLLAVAALREAQGCQGFVSGLTVRDHVIEGRCPIDGFH